MQNRLSLLQIVAMSDDSTLRKPGEMFTASVLKNITPLSQFLFVSVLSVLYLLVAKFIWQSNEQIMYGGCFGVVFYVMFNPWLCLLTTNNKRYLIVSWILYFLIAIVMYGIVYLWTGKWLENSWEVRIILITTTFYMVVAYGMMLGLKILFVDASDGGL